MFQRRGGGILLRIKSSRKYFAEVMKTMIKEHRALFVVCSWSFVLKMAFVDRKRGQDLKKIWCRTPIENLKNSPSPEELCSLCLERIMKRFQKKEGKKNLDTKSRTRRSHSRAFYHWDPSPKFEFPTILEITNFKLNRKFKFHTYPPLILVVSGSFIWSGISFGKLWL